jgi:hypothetical protein
MMFKSGSAVLKRGYVSNEIGIAATMYNLGLNNVVAGLAPPPAVSPSDGARAKLDSIGLIAVHS